MINQIILDKNIGTQMRDGTTLRSDIYRPANEGTYPVLLTRLPYGKDAPFYSHRYLDTNRLVENGFIVIIQDVRGRFNSDGEFFPFRDEAKDGYDTVEWAAHLPYSNGNVGMFGLSYYGFTQLLAAREQPPHLKAIFPSMTLNDLKNNMLFHEGVPTSASFKTWVLQSMVPDLLVKKYTNAQVLEEKMNLWAKALDNLPATYNEQLNDSWPLLNELGVAEEFFEVYQLAEDDDFWKQTSILDDYEKLHYPAIHLGGWYDSLLKSTIENFNSMTKHTKSMQRLIIGPWTHGDFGSLAGERDFGIKASESFLNGKEDLTHLHIRWFNYWLKNHDTFTENDAPVQLFIMGKNEWRNEQEWPLARTTYTPYYFAEGGQLKSESPTTGTTETYLHDPRNPVSTLGGQTLYHDVNTSGPWDQQKLEHRSDILIYETANLTSDIEVTGPIKVKLWAASEATCADFTAKLVDVCPDGTAYNLTDGIARVKMTDDQVALNNQNQPIACFEMDLWATSNLFLTNHKIRVEIASSNHPRFDVNWDGINEKHKQIKQTIFHGETYPSQIVLPIIK
ncbi:MAG TPA: CocE/NonD family hydrolase [Pseudogracilibacillus sp.]|nr:CocE/NonD family hydrolase [Pseudogracilibacillus sp.]